MSEEQKDDNIMSPTIFKLGYDNSTDPNVMLINIPLSGCADDMEYGTSILRGKLDEIKAIALKIIQTKREKKKSLAGIIKPENGNGLSVH